MDANYFKEHIFDELDGACDYIKKAIELKAMDQAMAKTFMEMSATELDHAAKLHEMFMKYYAKVTGVYKEPPAYLKEIKDLIDDLYPGMSANVLHMHDAYKM